MTTPRTIVQRLRHDAILVVGLILALLVLFVPPLQRLVIHIRDLELYLGTALMPALMILLGAATLHHQRKRHLATVESRAAAANLEVADERTRQLERLVAFGHAAANALDFHALRAAAQAHLVNVSGGRDAWVWLRSVTGEWHPLAQASATGRAFVDDDLVRVAEWALAQHEAGDAGAPIATASGGYECFPLVVGNDTVGVFATLTEGRPLSADGRQRLAAAASLLAIGVKNVDMVQQIREHSLRDALTGCCNRAHAVESLHVELRRAQRSSQSVSVIMLDLDHFKRINDRHGHLAGDAVLAHVGHIVRTTLRASDLKARYGGEEFLIVLPETPLAAARGVADALRRTFEQSPVTVDGVTIRITASVGLTCAAPHEFDEHQVIARADAALYAAKRAGRNCVRLLEPPGVAAEHHPAGMPHRRQRPPRPAGDIHAQAGIP